MIKIDLGCGLIKEAGWYGIDLRAYPGVDKVMNIGHTPLPFPDNSVSEIKCIHTLEHLKPEELFFCIDECWRVLQPDGFLHIEVPKAATRAYYINPDHRIQFIEDTFGYWQVPGNADTSDPHGMISGHWHVSVQDQPNPDNISVNMYPNKPGGKFEYKQVKTSTPI